MISRSSASCLPLVFAALTVGACATVADTPIPPRPIPYAEPAPGSMPQSESEPSDEVIGPRFGGPGGASARVRCPFANGVHGQAGTLLDRVGLVCYLEERGWDSPGYGGSGGQPLQRLCPPGARAIGIFGRSGDFIDQLGVRCGDGAGQTSYSAALGGNGGTPFEWMCPAGHALIGLDLMTGDYVDSVAPVCSRR